MGTGGGRLQAQAAMRRRVAAAEAAKPMSNNNYTPEQLELKRAKRARERKAKRERDRLKKAEAASTAPRVEYAEYPSLLPPASAATPPPMRPRASATRVKADVVHKGDSDADAAAAAAANLRLACEHHELIASARHLNQYPSAAAWPLPQVAVFGRTNSGKSSLLNQLFGGRALAKKSSKHGVTQALDFYAVDGRVMLVDTPGYGFNLDRRKKKQWTRMVSEYAVHAPLLRMACVLIDVSTNPYEEDRQIVALLRQRRVPTLLVLTKDDKLSGDEGRDNRYNRDRETERLQAHRRREERVRRIRRGLRLAKLDDDDDDDDDDGGDDNVFVVDATGGDGMGNAATLVHSAATAAGSDAAAARQRVDATEAAQYDNDFSMYHPRRMPRSSLSPFGVALDALRAATADSSAAMAAERRLRNGNADPQSTAPAAPTLTLMGLTSSLPVVDDDGDDHSDSDSDDDDFGGDRVVAAAAERAAAAVDDETVTIPMLHYSIRDRRGRGHLLRRIMRTLNEPTTVVRPRSLDKTS
jgi:GTP-binding protein